MLCGEVRKLFVQFCLLSSDIYSIVNSQVPLNRSEQAAARLRYPSAAMAGCFLAEGVGGATGAVGGEIAGFEPPINHLRAMHEKTGSDSKSRQHKNDS